MMLTPTNCHACLAPLQHIVADLGMMPLANSYIQPEQQFNSEPRYPLRAYICTSCWLMQVPTIVPPEHIFLHYAYCSSYSDTWLKHCSDYAQKMIERLHLESHHRVLEIASNDGSLLRYFKAAGISVLGIEPAENIAEKSRAAGINTKTAFFNQVLAGELKAQGYSPDLIAANNVLAHVPDIHGFIAGFTLLLKGGSTATFEFPHVMQLLRYGQFDTIYHEHFSYLSLTALVPLFKQHQLRIIDVERLAVHGGSLRIYVVHEETVGSATPAVAEILDEEEAFGLKERDTYLQFSEKTMALKQALISTLQQLRSEGKRIAAYGAPAKGNTLLNYCGIGPDLIRYTVDLNPEKQGRLMPGSRIPIYSPEYLFADKPDIILILPWNIADEIIRQMEVARTWGAQFMVAIPAVRFC